MRQLVLILQRLTKNGFLCLFLLSLKRKLHRGRERTQRELFVKLSVGCVIIHFNII